MGKVLNEVESDSRDPFMVERIRNAMRRSKTTVMRQLADATHEEAARARRAGLPVPEFHGGRAYILDAEKRHE